MTPTTLYILLGAVVLFAAYLAVIVLLLAPWAERAIDRASAETAAATFEADFIAHAEDVTTQEAVIAEAERIAIVAEIEDLLDEALDTIRAWSA